jgi:hypothetical protein
MKARSDLVDPSVANETEALLVEAVGSTALELSEACSDVLRECGALL